ncbi:MAG: hypothetical protein KC417_08475, partial [Myxococcales bacterium]|nr:hypothetical protein [Myxococcales bacterium]
RERAEAGAVLGARKRDAAEARRTWMARAVEYWTQTFASLSNWGSPIADVAGGNEAFNKAFGRSPKPRCSREECVKFYAGSFGIPIPGGTRLERKLELYLRLKLVDGNLERAEFLLPNNGFSRWYERENRSPVLDADPEQRALAINWALDRIVPALKAALPNAEREDVIPEPIQSPKVRAPNEPERIEDPESGVAEDANAGESGEGTPPPVSAPAASPAPPASPATAANAPTGGSAPPAKAPTELDKLLERASGEPAVTEAAPVAVTEPAAPPPEPESLSIPAALYALKLGALRVVVFAAPEGDKGRAYDGLYFEHVRPPAPEPATGKRPAPAAAAQAPAPKKAPPPAPPKL